MIKSVAAPRPLSTWERGTLEQLLSQPFHDSDELCKQAGTARVAEEYPAPDPSVMLWVDRAAVAPAPVRRRIPVEGEAADEDGTPVHVLLHVVDGYLSELEVYRSDGKPVRCVPEPSSLTLFC